MDFSDQTKTSFELTISLHMSVSAGDFTQRLLPLIFPFPFISSDKTVSRICLSHTNTEKGLTKYASTKRTLQTLEVKSGFLARGSNGQCVTKTNSQNRKLLFQIIPHFFLHWTKGHDISDQLFCPCFMIRRLERPNDKQHTK